MKIVAISDTHNGHNSVEIPPCDILIHAGDESYRGKKEEIEAFAKWFDKQPAKHLVWIPGNHSLGVEKHWPSSKHWLQDLSPRTNILMNSDVTLEGVKIWGSPVTPWFHDWAWNVIRGTHIKKYWDMIPADTSIVVTHGPPHGILDIVSGGGNVGCQDLREAMLRIKPKLHIFGHIHEGYGVYPFNGTTYVNASIMNEYYEPVNSSLEFEL
jgi:Icc-related predicted phosphoesterase